MQRHILLVEDDAVLRGGLVELFEREDYAVTAARCVQDAREKLSPQIELIVLDVGLTDGDGVSLCRAWREEGIDTPILFLTAKNEEIDVVRALDAGGNDYVTKPFRMQELLSRMRVLLRRPQAATPAQCGGLEIDAGRMQVKKDGQILNLTLTEYKVLTLLMSQRGVVPRERLLGLLWDDGAKFVDDNTLSVHISRLRDKIGARHIRTIRGVGYQWEA